MTDKELKDTMLSFCFLHTEISIVEIVAIFNLWATYKKNKPINIYIVMLACSTLLYSLFFVGLMFVANKRNTVNSNAFYCTSNASFLDKAEMWKTSQNFACIFSGISYFCGCMNNSFVFLCIFVELHLRVVWSIKDVTWYRYFYFYGFGVVWALLSLMYIVGGDHPGVKLNEVKNGFCRWVPDITHDTDFEYWGRYGLQAILFFVCMGLAIHGVYVCVRISLNARAEGTKNPIYKIWKTYRVLFLFMLYYMCLAPIDIAINIWLFAGNTVNMNVALTEFLKCLMAHFVSHEQDPSDGTHFCGETSKLRFPMTANYFLIAVYFVAGFTIAALTYTPTAAEAWWGLLPTVAQQFLSKYIFGNNKVVPVGAESTANYDAGYKTMLQAKSSASQIENDDDEDEEDKSARFNVKGATIATAIAEGDLEENKEAPTKISPKPDGAPTSFAAKTIAFSSSTKDGSIVPSSASFVEESKDSFSPEAEDVVHGHTVIVVQRGQSVTVISGDLAASTSPI